MDPITIAQLSMLLLVGYLLLRSQPGATRRGWRGGRRDPSIFPTLAHAARRREPETLRERLERIPGWAIGGAVLLLGALVSWLER